LVGEPSGSNPAAGEPSPYYPEPDQSISRCSVRLCDISRLMCSLSGTLSQYTPDVAPAWLVDI